jgi:hypothetical protein
MQIRRCRHACVAGLLALSTTAAAACAIARPIPYALPPGISAPFRADQLMASAEFAKLFCSVMAEPRIPGDWGGCDEYLEMRFQQPAAPLDAIPTRWTLLLVGGFGAECVADRVPAFVDAAEHLKTEHQIDWDRVKVSAFGSSEQNAAMIADYLRGQASGKAFIVVAHSKGAADVMVALESHPTETRAIAALITVAGAVGGSYLVDDFLDLNERLVKRLELPGCLGPQIPGAANAVDSMRREVRQQFLARSTSTLPSFSISAVAGEDRMSRALKPLWQRLRRYGREQDSHIVERESIVPWGTFLGRALGDHWAVAMPFEGRVDADVLEWIDRNHYPRVALIEAAVRYATARLPPS